MCKKNIKTFEQYKLLYELDDKISKKDTKSLEKYERLYLNYLLMMDVVDDNTNESKNNVIKSIDENYFDFNTEDFYNSFTKSKRISFLNPYSINDITNFRLFKLNGYDIGFAIMKNNEITLVHNNEPNINGIGDMLIKKAIELGGNKLNHFDGFLTGFYRRNGFIFNNNELFNESYKPTKWKYDKVNIFNPNKSIYINEYKVNSNIFLEAEKRYDIGKPDIVYRHIAKD